MKHTYIIGEIGQNHNGSVDLAKLLIEMVARPVKEELFGLNLDRIDAIKFQKRDLNEELSTSQMNKIYDSPHSFGRTYGEHRSYLELDDEEHFELYKYTKSLGFDFIETLCAVGCLSMLRLFSPDKLKVASRDLTNLPLLNALAETKIPMILSTGMAGKEELDNALEVITKYHNNISILHCVSEYPTQPQNVNLNTIKYLIKNYSEYCIGFSDHTIGIAMSLAAVAMGAEIIEKHITLDRRMKGTDQGGSLGPDGVIRLVRDIRLFEMAEGVEDFFIEPSVVKSQIKLERSIASKRKLEKGHTIVESDIHMLSPGDGFKWTEKGKVLGKICKNEIPANEIIYSNLIE